jgi:hypothetical protein
MLLEHCPDRQRRFGLRSLQVLLQVPGLDPLQSQSSAAVMPVVDGKARLPEGTVAQKPRMVAMLDLGKIAAARQS